MLKTNLWGHGTPTKRLNAGEIIDPADMNTSGGINGRSGDPSTGHLLTVVLEDYFHVAPLKSVVQNDRWYRFERRVEENTRKTLDLLDEFDTRATFLVLGWIADERPDLIREIVGRGHEVASKGYCPSEHSAVHQGTVPCGSPAVQGGPRERVRKDGSWVSHRVWLVWPGGSVGSRCDDRGGRSLRYKRATPIPPVFSTGTSTNPPHSPVGSGRDLGISSPGLDSRRLVASDRRRKLPPSVPALVHAPAC